jgi:DNA replication and repair protein RecF
MVEACSLFYLDSLQLKCFRNYKQLYLELHPKLNIITGENAQGKTNLIEAIYYLSVTRSFRTNRDQDLSLFPGQSFFLKGVFIQDELKNDLQINYYDRQLKVKIDNNHVNRYDHLQRFPVVVFSPDDLLIIREGPAIRRRFINLEASRLSQIYFQELRAYHRVLAQRNQLLKQIRIKRNLNQLLEPWDESLIKLGSNIIRFRLSLINTLEKEAKPFFSLMTGGAEEIKLKYVTFFDYSGDEHEIELIFKESLISKRDQELKRLSTAVGPHLDDLKIMINDFDSRKFSSQGQKRTAALALKMAEINLFCRNNGQRPIILLDDVFSELDQHRKEYLLTFLGSSKGQCFLTTAGDPDQSFGKAGKDSKLFLVQRGNIDNE